MLSMSATVSLAASSGRQRMTRSTSSISAFFAAGALRLSSAIVFTTTSFWSLSRSLMPSPVVPEPPSTKTVAGLLAAPLVGACLVSTRLVSERLMARSFRACSCRRRRLASWKQRDLLQPRGFRKSEHQVHVLDRLTGRALYQIVERRKHDRPILDAVGDDADLNIVGAAYVLRLRQHALFGDMHERLV